MAHAQMGIQHRVAVGTLILMIELEHCVQNVIVVSIDIHRTFIVFAMYIGREERRTRTGLFVLHVMLNSRVQHLELCSRALNRC